MSTLILPVGERDHISGNVHAPSILLEYGDYECPYCGAAYPIVKQIQKEMGEKLYFVFRNFPLSEIHPHALQAAYAAEAAGLQEAFWKMHDMLYEHQDALEDTDLLEYVQALDLDTEQFLNDMESVAVEDRVEEDFMSGVRSGVNGTPTFFINGVRHDDAYDYDTLLAALEKAGHT